MISIGADRFPRPTIVDDSLKAHRVKIHWKQSSGVDYYRLRLFNHDCTRKLDSYQISRHKERKLIKELTADKKYCIKMRAHYQDGTHDRFSKPRTFHTDQATTDDPDPLQFGVNFIRFYSDDSEALAAATTPEAIAADFNALGIDTFRQFTSGDLIWSNVETQSDSYDFAAADAIMNGTDQAAIATLFSYQLASSSSPQDVILGDTAPKKTLTPEAKAYIDAVVDHYKDEVIYWEIGNELAHWELEEPGAFPVAEQATWLAAVAAEIKTRDADAQIVLPGLINISTDNVDDWLPGIVDAAGSDWFDIVNYHQYNRWQRFASERAALQAVLEDLEIADKPIWLTETGTSSDVTNTRLTDYPNSETQQAADVIRRSIQAYAAGDALVLWHTYIGNDDAGEEFRYFGLITESLDKSPAYYTAQLLNNVILPFETVTAVDDNAFIYQVKQSHGNLYVAWSATTDSWTIPEGITEYTSVVPAADNSFTWVNVNVGDTVDLTTVPIIAR